MVVVENTQQIHNLVVCTLCSCYPWPTLGLPPTWYKSSAYRSGLLLNPEKFYKSLVSICRIRQRFVSGIAQPR